MSIKSVKSILGVIENKNHPVNAIYYTDINENNYYEVAIKFNKDRTSVEDISYKKLQKIEMDQKIFDRLLLGKYHGDIYRFHSIKKYICKDGEYTWKEEARFYFNPKNNILTVGIKYRFKEYLIIYSLIKRNEIFLYIQSTEVYIPNWVKEKPILLSIKFLNDKLFINGYNFEFSGIYLPGEAKVYE